MFKDTVPAFNKAFPGTKIAVLRIDGNYYDSYQDALYYLYPHVPVGGIIIFDDVMSHSSVEECWKDFKRDYQLSEELIQIDNQGAWFRKAKQITINWSLFRAPKDANKNVASLNVPHYTEAIKKGTHHDVISEF